jgi:hypothetical protein
MEPMQEAVEYRRDQQTDRHKEYHSGEQCIEGSEQLPSRRDNGIDRSHPAENHGCVQQRVDPWQRLKFMVPNNTDCQRRQDEGRGKHSVSQQSFEEVREWEQGFASMFVHI